MGAIPPSGSNKAKKSAFWPSPWKNATRLSRMFRHSANLAITLSRAPIAAFAVPNSASEETRQAVSDAIAAINADPDFQKQMIDGGFALLDVGYGDEMDAFIAENAAAYIKAAKSAGVIGLNLSCLSLFEPGW